ncbi:hypothetical protein [Neorhodopirellula pilleata]|uniref:Transmembrane protein n=1 Tax=Neorhodopirellula pilleata TaxID=2714738 RepID=A0A5C5ZZQ9_9BACT|nr:hypothetical protein [Neorhodopirellula pilleata]TWT93052.1 hypothetical protein Pla100_43680 [Neorhodopirellula pilleata]
MTDVGSPGCCPDPPDDPMVHSPDLPWTGAAEYWRRLPPTRKMFWRTYALWMGVLVALHGGGILASMIQAYFMVGGTWWLAPIYLTQAASAVTVWQIAIWWHGMHPQRPPVRDLAGVLALTLGPKCLYLGFVFLIAEPNQVFIGSSFSQVVWDAVSVGLVIVGLQFIRPLFGIDFIRSGTQSIVDVRTQWSIKGMFWVTGIAAFLFAALRFTITSWQDSEVADLIPPVPWMLAITSVHWLRLVVVLIGAVYLSVLRSMRVGLMVALLAILIAGGLSISSDRIFSHWWTNSGMAATSIMFTPIWLHVLLSVGMMTGHVWFFRRYLQAGYWIQVHSVVHANSYVRCQSVKDR